MSARAAGIAAAVLLAALAWNAASLAPWLARADSDFDAVNLYFPLARELASQGAAFLADERSLQAPPFSYAWPALLGPDLHRVKVVNLALSGLTLLLAFRFAWLMHSLRAGLLAAVLFAASPALRPFLATATTEPPFMLLALAWGWAIAEWLRGGRAAFAVLAAIAFALATLTRASLFYLAPVLVVGFAILALRAPPGSRRPLAGAAAAHGLALVLVGAFIARGAALFGFPFFATGAGNALYLGVSPLTGGYDSNYLGLLYDVGAIVQQPSHLTLSAERLLKGVATLVIREQPPLDLAAAMARKTLAFVFVTNAEPDVLLLRSWRIALVVFAVAGLVATRDRLLRLLVATVLLYQVAAHAPVLYTHRYSVAAVEPWLVVAAAVGLAAAAERWRRGVLTAGVATVGILAGAVSASGPRPEPDVYRAARVTVWSAQPRVDLAPVRTVDLEVRDAPGIHPWANHVVVVVTEANAAEACGPMRVAFRRKGEAAFSPEVARPAVGIHQWGGVPLGLNSEGTLRLSVDCPAGARLVLSRVAVVQPFGSLDARERYLGEAPRFAYER